MFYGWGNTNQRWALGDGNTLVCAYSYLSLMFIFKLAYKKKWFVIGDSRSGDVEVPRAQLEAHYGEDLPDIGLWSQFGMLITIAVIVVIAIVASAF